MAADNFTAAAIPMIKAIIEKRATIKPLRKPFIMAITINTAKTISINWMGLFA
jgi:hypothetical protein